MNTPFASVLVTTCNHKNFISECLDSILMQQTDYSFEIVVGVDYSTDGTREIVEDYQKKYPKLIKVLAFENKVGPIENGITGIRTCTGKYLGICDGDDYWKDPKKMQKQVDFLEKNIDYGLTYADVSIVNVNGHPIHNMEEVKVEYYKSGDIFWDLMKNCFINTNTVLLRRQILDELLHENRFDIKKKWFIYDYWFWLNIAKYHRVKFVNEKIATYRVHPESLSHEYNFYSMRAPRVKLDVISNLDISVVKNQHDRNIIGSNLSALLINKHIDFKSRVIIVKLLFRFRPSIIYLCSKFKKKYLSFNH